MRQVIKICDKVISLKATNQKWKMRQVQFWKATIENLKGDN
jgi:hypothetical protein